MGLKELMVKRNLTQGQLAAKVAVSQQAVSQWEKGQTVPRRKLWSRLATALDCTVEELLSCFNKEA